MSLLKVSEWQGGSGKWYVADTSTFSSWRHIPTMLGLSYEQYFSLLRDTYSISKLAYCEDTDCLVFSWNSEDYAKAHKYLLYVNRIARNKQYSV